MQVEGSSGCIPVVFVLSCSCSYGLRDLHRYLYLISGMDLSIACLGFGMRSSVRQEGKQSIQYVQLTGRQQSEVADADRKASCAHSSNMSHWKTMSIKPLSRSKPYTPNP